MIDNINTHHYPHNVHTITGPAVFSKGIRESLKENPAIPFTLFNGIEFRGYLKFKYKLGKFFLYKTKAQYWKQKQKHEEIIF